MTRPGEQGPSYNGAIVSLLDLGLESFSGGSKDAPKLAKAPAMILDALVKLTGATFESVLNDIVLRYGKTYYKEKESELADLKSMISPSKNTS